MSDGYNSPSPAGAGRLNRADVKRTLQVFLPTVPGPVLDYATGYAISSFASLTHSNNALGSGSAPPNNQRFTLRRMDSGSFGELSLTSPRERRHAKKGLGLDAQSLNFSWPDAPVPVEQGR